MKYTTSIVLAAFLYGASSIQLNQMSSISLADDEGADAEVAHEIEEGDAVEDQETAEAEDEAVAQETEEESEGEKEASEGESDEEAAAGSLAQSQNEELFPDVPTQLSEQ